MGTPDCVFGRRPAARRVIAACLGAAMLLAVSAPGPSPVQAALPSYSLYYAFDVPPAFLGLILTDSGTQKTYTGTLRGRLGGLALTSATYEYRPGSTGIGGGAFSLATPAGAASKGEILMTTDGGKTVLLFFGTYLGTRLEFSITGDREQVGGLGVTAKGLAQTGFASHEAYRAAVEKAVASLTPAVREQILSDADANPRLVSEYEQGPH